MGPGKGRSILVHVLITSTGGATVIERKCRQLVIRAKQTWVGQIIL